MPANSFGLLKKTTTMMRLMTMETQEIEGFVPTPNNRQITYHLYSYVYVRYKYMPGIEV